MNCPAWSVRDPIFYRYHHIFDDVQDAWRTHQATDIAIVFDRSGSMSLPTSGGGTRLDAAKATLFASRAKRVRPGQDDKILTSWNALAIAGLARAARACDAPSWGDLACAATDALRRTAWQDGRLLATRKGERAHLNAYLDDYAFLLQALLELMQTRFRLEDYAWARDLADVLLDEFEDPAQGGFFFTSHDHERLFHRSKPGHDNATPSGNGVAAGALVVLGHLCAAPRYVDAGERAVRLFAPALSRSPAGYASMLAARADLAIPPASVLLAGNRDACAAWQRSLERTLRPTVRIFNVAGIALPPELAQGAATGDHALAWVCRGTQCLPPIAELPRLERELAA